MAAGQRYVPQLYPLSPSMGERVRVRGCWLAAVLDLFAPHPRLDRLENDPMSFPSSQTLSPQAGRGRKNKAATL